MDCYIQTGNLKKKLILLIVDNQWGIGSTEENDSNISSITEVEEDDNSIDTSIFLTSLKTTPIGIIDRNNLGEIKELRLVQHQILATHLLIRDLSILVE